MEEVDDLVFSLDERYETGLIQQTGERGLDELLPRCLRVGRGECIGIFSDDDVALRRDGLLREGNGAVGLLITADSEEEVREFTVRIGYII